MPAQHQADDKARIAPGSTQEIGRVNAAISSIASRKIGANGSLDVFRTIARHRKLFRWWSAFARSFIPNGTLDRADTELVILRVAHSARSSYEWHHHAEMALSFGLTSKDVERVREGPDAGGWTPRQATLLRAADELHADRKISDPVWAELSSFLSDTELIELCMLVGHYEMLAMTLNSLQVEVEPPT